MIREWGTVYAWQDGVAMVSCDVKSSCNACASRSSCGTRVLNKLGPQTEHRLQVEWPEPLAIGQKVELGIAESSLLGSAMLVYMLPLAGLFVMGGLFQMISGGNFAPLVGALLGGVGGFLLARGWAAKLSRNTRWQPVIINVGLPPQDQIIPTREA